MTDVRNMTNENYLLLVKKKKENFTCKKYFRLTDVADESTRFKFLKKLIYSWPVFTLRSLLGTLLVYFVNVGLL